MPPLSKGDSEPEGESPLSLTLPRRGDADSFEFPVHPVEVFLPICVEGHDRRVPGEQSRKAILRRIPEYPDGVSAGLNVRQALEEELPRHDDRRVLRGEVLLAPILDRPSPLGYAQVVSLEDRPHA